MLEARKLTKRYDPQTLALDHLDLQVEPGQVYCLLGANGAGKTTTIHLFLGFIEPTAGSVSIHGIDMARDPLAAKKHVAYLPERVQLYGNLTARQNLNFFAELSGRRPSKTEIEDALVRAGLPEESFDRRVSTFSKGMRQKVAIATVLVKDAAALILDEPLSGLDPEAAARLVDELRGLRDAGKAILMSTHDVFRTKQLADRVGILRTGHKVLERDRPDLEHEDLEQLYLRTIEAGAEATTP